ncbi:MAG: molybdopterin-dependent oxidoreductase, partial [candidate division Zixibacteria bacterium]|nr:molybdopterin-dependent oxidoreductase [candidate division Zixibacteria bacterium]
ATLHSFSKLIRTTLGSNNIDFRTDYRMLPRTPQSPHEVLTSRPFTIADIDDSDVIVTFGTDLLKEHRNEYLRVRRAFNFNNSKIYVLNPYQVKAADVAVRELTYTAGCDETLINAICLAAMEDGLADGGDLKSKISPSTAAEAAQQCGVALDHVREVAQAIAGGRKITFIIGEIVNRSQERELISAALCNLNRLFGIEKRGQIAILGRYANSAGAAKLGLLPDPAPAVKSKLTELWGKWPEAEPLTADKMLVNMKKEEVNGGIILGDNPVMLYPDREFIRVSLEKLDFLVVADMFETETTALADVVLPLSTWAEYDGYYVNLEGRTQRANKALPPMFESRPGYAIVDAIAEQMGAPLFATDQARHDEIKQLLAIDSALPWPEGYLEVKPAPDAGGDEYPMALFIGDDPHHSGYVTEKANSLMNFVGEAYIEMSPSLARSHELSTGDSVRVESEVGKIIVPVKVSDTIRNDVVFIPRNFASTAVTSLLMRKRRVDRVKISKVER